jgi:hypothetical protein
MTQIPSIGRIVHYQLSERDVDAIMRRRTTGAAIAERIAAAPKQWPIGAQAHIGNAVHEGDVFPMMITRAWGSDEARSVNGQVFLDGCDVFWATSVHVGDDPGTFVWPTRT